ncbi:MAG: hypothetical protein H0W86_12820 [Armatimonadetes bacterium]|nr:hypothetical protein [Armatimonadota bacterium]
MSDDLKAAIRDQISDTGKMFLEDLRAMSHDQLATSPGGVARMPYDFAYECVYVNQRCAKRMRGEDPGSWPAGEGFMTAPPDYQNRDYVTMQFEESVAGVLAGWDSVPSDQLTRTIELPKGSTNPLDLAKLIVTHLAYHDGQLNYHQTIGGDAQMHWED